MGWRVLQSFFGPEDPSGVCFLEDSASEGTVFKRSPFQPAGDLMEKLYAPASFAVFVSATLATSSQKSRRPLLPMMARTGWYCGEEARWREFKSIPSPFDYRTQMAVKVATGLPRYQYSKDKGAAFFKAVDEALPKILMRQGGGCLVLCTAHDHVERLFKRSEHQLEAQGVAVYRQARGRGVRPVLERFKEDLNSCLFGTLSLWEGVDVPGEALRTLVIVKLPYDHPEDPVLKARLQDFERYASILPSESREGLRPLNHYYLPLMVTKLRQGVGRLIRSETDRGELVFLDRRLMESKGRPTLTFILNSLGLDLKDVEELET
jgi:Rad3-related DNA helicase